MTEHRSITIPELSLVALIGASSSGKSTFARKHFKPTEVLSSDFCRAVVSDDENDLAATADAFEVLHYIAGKRLASRRLTVVDATNVQPEARKPIVSLARKYHVLPVAIILDVPQDICITRNASRADRNLPVRVIRNQLQQLRRSIRGLEKEGFRHVFHLRGQDEIESITIQRQPLWTDRRTEHGPFDIIGDVHGCCDELEDLLTLLGYVRDERGVHVHPQGRRVVFLGDIVDRGPRIIDALRTVMAMCDSNNALCLPGNHDVKLLRKLIGRNVQITHGLADTLSQLDAVPEPERAALRDKIRKFIDGLVSHYVFDDGKLVVAHAGMKEEMQGRASRAVRDFAMYGETTGETDEFGLPVRYNWASEYHGHALVVYGHTPVPEPEWLNRTINIDTGCVFGGRLTALRYPEKEIVSVPARRTYCNPARPFRSMEPAHALTAQQQQDDLLDIADYLRKLIVSTRLGGNVVVREENSAAALEVMTRFAVDPKWLIYLPPTMSPSETSQRQDTLESPEEAFTYYRHQGVPRVVCEEKHMGSRAVIILCRDALTARKRFGVITDTLGICFTRTGRPFFHKKEMEKELLTRLHSACDAAEFWQKHDTEWLCLDAEIMPWSVKAQQLILRQYASTGAAGKIAMDATLEILSSAAKRGLDMSHLQSLTDARKDAIEKYQMAFRQYCWEVNSIDDIKVAPFHLLATETKVHIDKDHIWHMNNIQTLCDVDPALLIATPYREVDVMDDTSQQSAIGWWEELTSRGSEGIVVKPNDFIVRSTRGLVQPAIKCRGREYLRIIYGPEYLLPQNLERLRSRGLGFKRTLALREFALGIEALERFVGREPLQRVHECVFAILAMESEPVDPRL